MASINKLALVKGAAELVTAAGVSAIVGNLVRATTPDDINKFQKVVIGIGGYSLAAVLGGLSGKYIADQIDDYATTIQGILKSGTIVEIEVAPEDKDVDPEVEAAPVEPAPAKKTTKPTTDQD
jgi:hypothetical protein